MCAIASDTHDLISLVAFVAIVATLIIKKLRGKCDVAILWQFVATKAKVWQWLWQCGNDYIYLCQ